MPRARCFVYGLGIPFFGVFVLFRRRHKLQTGEATQLAFGFLYDG